MFNRNSPRPRRLRSLSTRLLATGYTLYGYDPNSAAQPPGAVRLDSEHAVTAEVAAVLTSLADSVEMLIDTTTGDPAAVN